MATREERGGQAHMKNSREFGKGGGSGKEVGNTIEQGHTG